MSTKVRLFYLASTLLPLLSLSILMLRLAEPYSRALGLSVYGLGWLCLILGVRAHDRFRAALRRGKDAAREMGLLKKRRLASFFVLACSLLVLPWILPFRDHDYLLRDLPELSQQMKRDVDEFEQIQGRLPLVRDELVNSLDEVKLNDSGATARLRRAWASYLDLAVRLDQLVLRHSHFYQVAIRSSELADRGFLLGFSALAEQALAGSRIATSVRGRRYVETLLNEPVPELGLPSKSYLRFEQGLLSVSTLTRLAAGRSYLRFLLKLEHFAHGKSREFAHQAVGTSEAALEGLGKDPRALLDSPLDRLEKEVFVAWFPLQRGAAKVISPVRTTHRDNYVGLGELREARKKLLPGDVLLERRDGYLTNLGIPGFWPHAALYVGSLEEIDQYFRDSARRATSGLSFSEYLAQRQPEAHRAMQQIGSGGHPPSVIEAVGHGVIVQAFEESGRADYLAALAPRIDRELRLRALVRAFSHFGEPYDYNFDFATDETVVCSELVAKALLPVAGEGGIAFPLTRQNGRFLLPPNDIARFFDERGSEASGLDFVFFLDGDSDLGAAVFENERVFRESYRRPQWKWEG